MTAKASIIRLILLGAALTAITGCIGTPKCDTEGRYQESRSGERIDVPEDMDAPESYKEMTIPKASPGAQPEGSGRCLEMPPPISSGRS